MKSEETAAEKAAVSQVLKNLAPSMVKTPVGGVAQAIFRANEKQSDSHLATVSILHDEKPTYAGENEEKLTAKKEEPVLAAEGDTAEKSDHAAEKAMLNKMSVVLSRAVRHAMSNGQGYTPANVGLSGRPTPMPAAAPPMPVGAPQAQQQPQQQPQNPAQYQGALGGPGAISPSSNPINNYGPLSASGDINGNAAFGVKNSPGSSKSAGSISKILDQAKAVEEGKKVENVKPKFKANENKADLDPTEVIAKAAQWAEKEARSYTWGGQRWQLGQTGINPQAGYGYLLGTIPTPDVALRVGTPSFGAGIGLHPLPYMFFDKGQPSGRHGRQPRSLYKYIGDNMMSPEDAFFIELGKIPDGAPPERFEKLLRDRGIGRTSQEIQMLSEVLASSPDVKRNAMTRRLPAAMSQGVPAANIKPAPTGAKSLANVKPEGMKIGADLMAPYLKQNQRYQQLNRYAGLVTPALAGRAGSLAGVGPLASFGASAAHMGVGNALAKQRQMMQSVQSMQNAFGK